MIILATVCDTARVGVLLDLETGQMSNIPCHPEFLDLTVVNRAPCRPFGITWSDQELFIANNRQLLVFDRELSYLRTEKTPLQVNTHQLAYHSNQVWAASPWTNSLIGAPLDQSREAVEFDLFGQTLKPYVRRDAQENDDVCHINSLLWAKGHLFVAAHNLGKPSFIFRYNDETLRLDSMQTDVGLSIHGLAYCDGELYWISTNTNEVRSDKGYRLILPTQRFWRGLAVSEEYFIVAASERRRRVHRTNGDSWVQLIRKITKEVVAEYHLQGTGSINDLRLLDEYDYAHCVAPFWQPQSQKSDIRSTCTSEGRSSGPASPNASGEHFSNRRTHNGFPRPS